MSIEEYRSDVKTVQKQIAQKLKALESKYGVSVMSIEVNHLINCKVGQREGVTKVESVKLEIEI